MTDLKKIFEGFSKLKIAVVGDVMVDSYILGNVTRISPEAPVPIINLDKKEDRLGGAANVALNLVALGVQTEMISVIGEDEAADSLERLFKAEGIDTSGIVKSADRKTTIKTRVIGNHQHLLRVDNEQTDDISSKQEEALLVRVRKSIENGVNALVLEDYNKGVLTERVIHEIVNICNDHGVVTTVDPKKKNFLAYRGVTLFKPNLKEIKEGLNVAIDMSSITDLQNAVMQLESILKNKISFVTLSEHGVFIKDSESQVHIKAHLRDIADVSGAGDTVIATATACLASKMTIKEIAEISNLAGGIVCEQSGVVAIDKGVLLREAQRIQNGY
ncbi:MAG: D-glycero-beta-D-manno-heptose-7-phosphate kinase [Bacteroidetes bacterium]|nr:D-glycero-beta-D-manno-heptose-7-phosphate kinase [Bacteroidota bacterium]